MNLDTTLKVLRIVLGEAKTTNDCDITASYADSMINNFSLGNQNEKSNGTTPVIVVAAPVTDAPRQVKEIRLFNNDTVPHTVTLQLFDGTNTWIVGTTATADPVPVGGSFVYTPESGVCCTGGGGGTSLTVEDDTGHTIASVGTLTFKGVVASGSSPSAITNMTTITGAPGIGSVAGTGILLTGGLGPPSSAAASGESVQMYGGSGGTGTVNTYGGEIFAGGGNGGSGTYSVGGSIIFNGGNAGAFATNGIGGRAQFSGGFGYGTGAGGAAAFYGGQSTGSGAAGDVIVQPGNAGGSGAGGNAKINLGSGSPPGTMRINNDPSLIVAAYSWVAGAQLNNQTIFTTTREMQVTAVIGRPDIVNGGAATLVIVKAASGTAPAGGTALTSTSMDLTGTANTNQTLTLSATLADITLAAGDSLCMVTTGVLAASAGCITVWGTPQ
jgi:hypothetical protein